MYVILKNIDIYIYIYTCDLRPRAHGLPWEGDGVGPTSWAPGSKTWSSPFSCSSRPSRWQLRSECRNARVLTATPVWTPFSDRAVQVTEMIVDVSGPQRPEQIFQEQIADVRLLMCSASAAAGVETNRE